MAPSDTINTTNNPQIIQGLITRARARQLDHQVNSFLAVHVSLAGLLLNSCDIFFLGTWEKHYNLTRTSPLEGKVYSDSRLRSG